MAGENPCGDGGPVIDKGVATGEFHEEDTEIDDDDEGGDYGDAHWAPGCIAQRDKASHSVFLRRLGFS